MGAPAAETDKTLVDKETSPGNEAPHTRRPSQPEHQPSDLEKERLAAYEGHDADIPSNEGYILDERGELRRQESIVALHRKASHGRKSQDGTNSTQPDAEKRAGDAFAEESDGPNVVYWDGPDDPQNPINYSRWSKVTNIMIISAICFVTPLASSMFVPGVPDLMAEFKSDNVLLASFVVSVYVLGFAIGPLFFAPLSEIYGRAPVYHFCNIGFLCFTVGCALATNLNMLIGFRFIAGAFGSAPLTNGKRCHPYASDILTEGDI